MDSTSAANSPKWPFRVIIASAATLTVTLLIALAMARHKLTVTVANDGPERLRQVVVHVTGRSYPLGDLEAGAEKTVGIAPTSDSSVEIEFVDSAGSKKRLDADCYLEPGHHRGEMTIHFGSEQLKRVEDDTYSF